MSLDGRSLIEIEDSDIELLVREHVVERQKIEYKITINYSDDKNRVEFLNDVVSMANSNGGYIIVGIREDGSGRAQIFEPGLVGDVERIKKSCESLCFDYISMRIVGIEFETRMISDNPILIIRVPESVHKPHMVTYNNNTKFTKRYYDGKREMTHDEIKSAFQGDYTLRKITEIETHIGTIMQRLTSFERKQREPSEGEVIDLLRIVDGEELHDRAYRKFITEVGNAPYLWLAISPKEPHKGLLDVDDSDIHDLLRHAPESRDSGWNMGMQYFHPETIAEGISIGDINFEIIKLYENGLLEFWTPLDEHFCWKQDPEEYKVRPRLYPYPVVEYPVSFLRLYKALVEKMEYNKGLILSQYYVNSRNYALLPYRPGMVRFDHADIKDAKVNEEENIKISYLEIENNFSPDIVAFELLRRFYGHFGFSPDQIPFYSAEEEIFSF